MGNRDYTTRGSTRSSCLTPAELAALLQASLAPPDHDRIEHHLWECHTCRERLDAQSLTIAAESPHVRLDRPGPPPESSPQLRRAMEQLKSANPFLHGGGLPGQPSASDPGLRQLGGYELGMELGRGGMGIVYRARQRSLQRDVALKVILAGRFASPAQVRRFHVEAEAAANLDHPHIIPILEVGEHEGLHYFSMKLVEGGSLAQRGSEFRIPSTDSGAAPRHSELEARNVKLARLIAAIAHAVHYAHERGVLHRDLKPGNILIDADGRPHVADFGLAKLLDQDSDLTLSWAVMGSPNYMAPEMAAGKPREVTTAADVYSLGAILFELLTGRPPFAEETPLATMRAAVEQEPKHPSVLSPDVDRDLETICLKCLEKDPAHRYTSAQALAEDLERWMRHEPILARRSSTWERGAKWARRHPARAGLLLASLVAPSVLAVVLLVSSTRITSERNRALAQEQIAHRARSEAEAEKLRAEASEQAQRAHTYAADIYSAFQALEKDDFAYAYHTVERYLRTSNPGLAPGHAPTTGLLGFEWRLLWKRTRGEFACAITNLVAPARCLLFDSSHHTLLTGSEDGIHLWSVPEGKSLGEFPRSHGSASTNSIGRLRSMLFVHHGRRLLLASDDRVSCWSYPEGDFLFALPEENAEMGLSSDGKTLAVGVWDTAPGGLKQSAHPYSVVLYDTTTWKAKEILPGYGHKVAISPDGASIVSGSRSNGVVLWHPQTDTRTKIKRDHGSGGMSFSPDSTLLAVGGWQKSIHVLDIGTLRRQASFTGYQLGADALVWAPDGTNLLSVGQDQTIKLWSVPSERTNRLGPNVLPDRPDLPPSRTFFGHMAPVTGLALSGDGGWMASASLDRTVMIWDLHGLMRDVRRPVLPAGRGSRHLEPVTGCVITYAQDGLAVWDPAASAAPARVLPDTENMLFVGSLAGGGNFVALYPGRRDDPARLEIRELPDGRIRSRVEMPELTPAGRETPASSTKAAISPDGRWLAVSRPEGSCLLSLSDRKLQPSFQALVPPAKALVQTIVFSPDNRWLVLTHHAANESSLTVVDMWQCKAGPVIRLAGEPDSMTAAVMDPGSHFVATGGERQNSIRIWELSSGRLFGRCNGNVVQGGIAWSPDGQTLATLGFLGLKLWSAAFCRELATLEHRSGFIPCGFTADGKTLVSCSNGGLVRRDTAPSLQEIFDTTR